MVQRLVESFSAWSVQRRGLVLVLASFFSLIFAAGLPSLRVDTSPDALVSDVEGHADVARRFRGTFGGSSFRLVLLVQGTDVLSPAALRYQRRLAHDLEELDVVARVEGLPSVLPETIDQTESSAVREKTLDAWLSSTPWVVPLFLSRGREAAGLFVDFSTDQPMDQAAQMQALQAVRARVGRVTRPEGIQIDFGGVPVLSEAIQEKLERDRLTLNPAMMIICLLVLALTFRWWPAVVAPLLAVGMAALGVVGGLAFLQIPLSILTNIIPPLLIIVGLSDSVHLLGRYEEELLKGSSRKAAGERAARAMIVACFLTSITTAVGFGSLAMAETAELGRFGLAAAAGVVLAYFSTVFVVPAFVTLFDRRATGSDAQARVGRIERLVFALTLWVLTRAKWVAGFSFVAMAMLIVASANVTADARLLDAFEESEPVSVLTRKMESKLVGIRPLEIMLEADASLLGEDLRRHVADVARWAESRPDVISATGFFDVLPQALDEDSAVAVLREYGSWISPDAKTARMTVFFRDSGIRQTLETLRQLELRLQDGSGLALGVSFTGEAYTGSVGRDSVLRDLLFGLGFALISIFVLLGLLFRSVRLALATIPPNVLPLLATGAYMTVFDIHLNLATVITFSIGIGLAVDDSVHVVARFRDESTRIRSVRVCLTRAARGTGRAIVVTALSLCLGFSVLLLSEFVSVRQFGELIAFTVASCLVSALIVQPALVYLLVRRRWGSR